MNDPFDSMIDRYNSSLLRFAIQQFKTADQIVRQHDSNAMTRFQ